MNDPPRAAPYWAKQWGVHRETALKLLRHLHRQHGSKVVWFVGRRRIPVATEASLSVVKILRAERNLILVVDRHSQHAVPVVHRREIAEEENVTQEQFSRALADVWKALHSLGARRF